MCRMLNLNGNAPIRRLKIPETSALLVSSRRTTERANRRRRSFSLLTADVIYRFLYYVTTHCIQDFLVFVRSMERETKRKTRCFRTDGISLQKVAHYVFSGSYLFVDGMQSTEKRPGATRCRPHAFS